MDLCLLCSKEYNCTPVDEKIVSQVEYLLPEITIFKLGIRFCICSICDGALYSFSKFKQASVENIRRLEARIKGAQTSPIPFNNPFVLHDNETSDTKLGTTEKTSINDEYLEQTPLDTQMDTNRAFLNPIALLETNSTVPHKELHTDTNACNTEDHLIKKEHIDEIPREIPSDDDSIKNIETKTEYRCNICSKLFEYKALLSRHIRKNHLRIKILSCKLCKMLFIRKYDLKKHMELHNGIKNFPCFICKKRFVNNRSLKQHIILHSEQKVDVDTNKTVEKDCYECTVCNKKFKSKYYVINRHMNTHSVKKLYECEFCDEAFNRKTKLAVHRKSHIKKKEKGIEKIFSCSFCNKVFKQKHHLNYHLKIHYGVRDFKCKVCKKNFLYRHHLTVHMKIHLGKKDHKCEVCNKAFLLKDQLTAHLKVHSEVRDFGCEICGKTFKWKGYLGQHMRRHAQTKAKLYECSICKRQFSHKHYLVGHLESHTQPTSQELFKCEICKKSFYGKNRLNGHMGIHARKNVNQHMLLNSYNENRDKN